MSTLLQTMVVALMVQGTMLGVMSNRLSQKNAHMNQMVMADRDAFQGQIQKALAAPETCWEMLQKVDFSTTGTAAGLVLMVPGDSASSSPWVRPDMSWNSLLIQEISVNTQDCDSNTDPLCGTPANYTKKATLVWEGQARAGSARKIGGTIGPIYADHDNKTCVLMLQGTSTGSASGVDCQSFGGDCGGSRTLQLTLRNSGFSSYPFVSIPLEELSALSGWEMSTELRAATVGGCPVGYAVSQVNNESSAVAGAANFSCEPLVQNLGNCARLHYQSCYYQGPSHVYGLCPDGATFLSYYAIFMGNVLQGQEFRCSPPVGLQPCDSVTYTQPSPPPSNPDFFDFFGALPTAGIPNPGNNPPTHPVHGASCRTGCIYSPGYTTCQ
jgi:hypothetical protein